MVKEKENTRSTIYIYIYIYSFYKTTTTTVYPLFFIIVGCYVCIYVYRCMYVCWEKKAREREEEATIVLWCSCFRYIYVGFYYNLEICNPSFSSLFLLFSKQNTYIYFFLYLFQYILLEKRKQTFIYICYSHIDRLYFINTKKKVFSKYQI